MKYVIVFTALLLTMIFAACSKDKGGGGANPYNGYAQGPYAPGYNPYCGQGQIPAVPYNNYYQGQPVQNVNCYNQNQFGGMNPYYMGYGYGYNTIQFVGTCDFRLPGPQCPPGYYCQPIGLASQGVCAGGYY